MLPFNGQIRANGPRTIDRLKESVHRSIRAVVINSAIQIGRARRGGEESAFRVEAQAREIPTRGECALRSRWCEPPDVSGVAKRLCDKQITRAIKSRPAW